MLKEIRDKISYVNNMILNHRIFSMEPKIEILKIFYDQQWYIINHDLRSLSIMLSRVREQDELDFFVNAIKGDYEAVKVLRTAAEKKMEPLPQAVSYTHYLSWLANYANTGEQVLALTVNYPVWVENCRKLYTMYKGRADVRFLEIFANSELDEVQANKIISRYSGNYLQVATLIQSYELMFWDSILTAWERLKSN
jgi:hypothetical protein